MVAGSSTDVTRSLRRYTSMILGSPPWKVRIGRVRAADDERPIAVVDPSGPITTPFARAGHFHQGDMRKARTYTVVAYPALATTAQESAIAAEELAELIEAGFERGLVADHPIFSTQLLDDFQRADANPISGSWLAGAGGVLWRLLGHQAVSQAGVTSTMEFMGSVAGDVETYCDVAVWGDGPLTLAVRGSKYRALFTGAGVRLGTAAHTLPAVAHAIPAGSSIGVRLIGTVLSAYVKPVAGDWVLVTSTELADIEAGGIRAVEGRLGVSATDASTLSAIDNFSGGPVVPQNIGAPFRLPIYDFAGKPVTGSGRAGASSPYMHANISDTGFNVRVLQDALDELRYSVIATVPITWWRGGRVGLGGPVTVGMPGTFQPPPALPPPLLFPPIGGGHVR